MSLTLLNVIDDPAIAINLQSNILRTRKNNNQLNTKQPIKQLNTYLVPMQALCHYVLFYGLHGLCVGGVD